MRVWLAVLLGVALTVVVAVLVHSRIKAKQEERSRARGRQEGLDAANEDIARGTPWIRRFLEAFDDLDSGGIALDRETGLPLHNAWLSCGTGVDGVAYAAEVEAYNERILAAYADGSLKRYRLSHKLRDRPTVRALFATASPVRLANDGDTVSAARGEYVLTYHHEFYEDGSDHENVTLSADGKEDEWVPAVYPVPYDFGPETLWPTYASAPFDALVVDDETTIILRDAAGHAWIIDLPRALIVQVVPTR